MLEENRAGVETANTSKRARQEGMRELLLRQIERRFGPLPEERRRSVEAITSPVRLKRLADKILTARPSTRWGSDRLIRFHPTRASQPFLCCPTPS